MRTTKKQPAIVAKNITVRFKPYVDRKPTLRRTIANLRHRAAEEIVALDDVSLTISRGEAFGVIGSNGAGKSTLLRVLARTLLPDGGSIEVRGRTSTLLQLGVGFNAELSGRRNVYLGGLASGLTKARVDEVFDDIVDYAELWDAIDRPIKTYSSGMFARLAFSVGMHLDPEILFLDEVLAVGDEAFRQRSMATMEDLLDRSGTIVFVSHALPKVAEFCDRALWLEHGKVRMIGPAADVVSAYTEEASESSSAKPMPATRPTTVEPAFVVPTTLPWVEQIGPDALAGWFTAGGAMTLELDEQAGRGELRCRVADEGTTGAYSLFRRVQFDAAELTGTFRFALRGWESVDYVAAGFHDGTTFWHDRLDHPDVRRDQSITVTEGAPTFPLTNGWKRRDHQKGVRGVRLTVRGIPGPEAEIVLRDVDVRAAEESPEPPGAWSPSPDASWIRKAVAHLDYLGPRPLPGAAGDYLKTGEFRFKGPFTPEQRVPWNRTSVTAAGEQARIRWQSLELIAALLCSPDLDERTTWISRDHATGWILTEYGQNPGDARYTWHPLSVPIRALNLAALRIAGADAGFEVPYTEELDRVITHHLDLLAAPLFEGRALADGHHPFTIVQQTALLLLGAASERGEPWVSHAAERISWHLEAAQANDYAVIGGDIASARMTRVSLEAILEAEGRLGESITPRLRDAVRRALEALRSREFPIPETTP